MIEKPPIKRASRTLIHKGAIIDFYRDIMVHPDGREEAYDFIGHNGAAAVLPVDRNGKIILVKQYRNALERYTLEIPAGGLKTPDEPTKEAAIRELEEETGFRAAEVTKLLTIRTTVAFCNEKIDIYLAKQLTEGKQHLDEGEYVSFDAYELDDLCQRIYDGQIEDSKTVSAIMAYKSMLSV